MDETTSVRLIEALAAIWTAIRRYHREVPPVVILAAPAQRGQEGTVLGHFAPFRWSATKRSGRLLHEVVVVAESLDRSAAQVAATILHEAAHSLSCARKIFDCSPTSQYHNGKFRDAAVELGLDVARVAHYGYAYTTLPPATAEQYATEIAALEHVLVHRRSPPRRVPTPGPKGPATADDEEDADRPKSRSRKATCSCPFVIRVAKATMEATTIRCETCGEPFRLA